MPAKKNDFRDVEAIAEALPRPTMKFVATKNADQLGLQPLHRIKTRHRYLRVLFVQAAWVALVKLGPTTAPGAYDRATIRPLTS